MSNFAICDINGKQYKIESGKVFEASEVSAENLEIKVLAIVKDDKLDLGKPYLTEKLKIKVLEQVKKAKIRVAKFHAKANYRKVTGYRQKALKLLWES